MGARDGSDTAHNRPKNSLKWELKRAVLIAVHPLSRPMVRTPQGLDARWPSRQQHFLSIAGASQCPGTRGAWSASGRMPSHERDAEREKVGAAAAALVVCLQSATMRWIGFNVENGGGKRAGALEQALTRAFRAQMQARLSMAAQSMLVYTAEFISAFGDRMWQFAIPLLYMDVWQDTLLPTVAYYFILNISLFFLLPIAGKWVDTQPRLRLMMTTIIVDNVCVVASCFLLFCTTFYLDDQRRLWLIFLGILIVCIPGEIMVRVGSICLEKDWVPVISATDQYRLTLMNSRLTVIDLSCKFLAPMAFGFAMQFVSTQSVTRIRLGALLVVGYNLITALPEIYFVGRLYSSCPALAAPHARPGDLDDAADAKAAGSNGAASAVGSTGDESESAAICGCFGLSCQTGDFWASWRLFRKHPIALASVSFSALYGTVLSPGSLLIAYLKWVGVEESLLGASIGGGALMGGLGAWLFPLMRGLKDDKEANSKARMSLGSIGIVSIWLWFVSIAPVAVLLVLQKLGITNLSGIAVGRSILFFVVFGRVWLWTFDLAERQLLQERVDGRIRGRISSVQTSLCQLFTTVIYTLGIIFYRPQQFYVLCYASVGFIFMAALFFTIWFAKYSDKRAFDEATPLALKSAV